MALDAGPTGLNGASILMYVQEVLALAQIVDYKGVQGNKKYIPYSEYDSMRFGDGSSHYWHDDTMTHLRRHLDMPLETSLGYFYTDIFNRCLLCDRPVILECLQHKHLEA